MTEPSPVNFVIRPNKNVERKLIFDALAALHAKFDYQDAQYIGFGSLWFADFVLAHKTLSIQSMTSIEKRDERARRADFSKPFSCIEVIPGDSTIILPTLPIKDRVNVCWLDYECPLKSEVIEDIETILDSAPSRSILLVTLNASKGSIPKLDKDDNEISLGDSLRMMAGDYVPDPLLDDDISWASYPRLLAQIIIDLMMGKPIRSARDVQFRPFVNLFYQDNAPMITVGGVLLNETDEKEFNLIEFPAEFSSVINNIHEQQSILVPALTVIEKVILDQNLPQRFLDIAHLRELGIAVSDEEIEAYARYYLHYPVFSEFVL